MKGKNDRLTIKVSPNASRSGIAGVRDGVLQIRVAAPPVEGRANKELIEVLAKALGVRKSAIRIIKGQTGRNKVIEIEGMSGEEIITKIQKPNQISNLILRRAQDEREMKGK